MSDFIQQCVAQEVGLDAIDDFIDQWHDDPRGKSLHEFLGMTRTECALWVEDASFLPAIVRIRAHNMRLDDLRLPAEVLASSQGLTDWLQTQSWEQPAAK